MSANITSWVDPHARTGERAQSLSMTWREDGRVDVDARDRDGREVVVTLPGFVWLRMAQEIGWNAPRRAATLAAARLGLGSQPA